ncbi:MAG: hypothetical protein ACRCY8_02985 [Dermatophilaceae bacterium]
MSRESRWAYASSKLGSIQPATLSTARELFDAAADAGHDIWFMWGMGGGKEHGSGRALDLMVRNHAAGEWIRNYLWTHRDRLRLHHVIWAQTITSTVVQPGVRRKMADRGNSTENHYDHNHVWFKPGDYRAPNRPTPQEDDMQLTDKIKVKLSDGTIEETTVGQALLRGAYAYDSVTEGGTVDIRLDREEAEK